MRENLQAITKQIQTVIVGKESAITRLLICVLASGHALLDDVPGVGKTTLAMAVAKAMGLRYRRIQFTPDVLPSDITGFSVYNRETGGLAYMPGVANDANILLGDEINRTSSKTQSALLEAMEERQVTVDGTTHPLQSPFIVIATQNNVGTAGTQLLPFAQLDRFLMRLSLGYPCLESQMAIIRDRQTGNPIENMREVATIADVLQMQHEVQNVMLKDSIISYIARLAEASRAHEHIELGISPRGALFIARAAKARAYLLGRDYVIPDDVREVFADVCGHRMILRTRTENMAEVMTSILGMVAPPDSNA